MDIVEQCVESYRRLKNLKLAGAEIGIPWQTVYIHLKTAGEPVTGDKARYGSDSDRLAARAERLFAELVPEAVNMNGKKFQAKMDFQVGGWGVDVKASRLNTSNRNSKTKRWAFGVKKQESVAAFFVCFCMADDDSLQHVLLIPGEIARTYQTISAAQSGSKWLDYKVEPDELAPFFENLLAA
ncbi:hypothetical protein WG219_11355 [Ectopseudomonas mendocina]|uniref:Restriction endonuclease n=1 Tax=Ectopseudomonas mendocina TaxID=300 RepID=A0ABZ2RC85_ECTME